MATRLPSALLTAALFYLPKPNISPIANFDEHDEADEETNTFVNREVEDAEKNDAEPYGKPGSFLNRLIMHGNKKTEDEIATENAARASQNQRQTQSST